MMYHLNNKKNNLIVRAATLVTLATIIVVATAGSATIIGINRSADAFVIPALGGRTDSKAPVVVSGDNIYVAWWTNNTANNNEEVMFRASNDGGQTFGPLLRLATNGTISSTEGEEGEAE